MEHKCTYCGAKLAEGASFCPHCAKPLIAKRVVPVPRPRKRAVLRWGAAILVLAVLLCGAGAWFYRGAQKRGPEQENLMEAGTPDVTAAAPEAADAPAAEPEPKLYDEGGAEATYADEDGVWHLVLTFSEDSGLQGAPQPAVQNEIPDGVRYAYPSQLYIHCEGTDEDVSDVFMQKVSRCAVQAIAEEGASAMECSEARYNDSFPAAARMADVFYWSDCGTNEVLWTIFLKNGDTINLRQIITITRRALLEYHFEDTPLDTMEELTALLTQINEETDEDTAVNIYLPPVIYEGELTLSGHACSFFGSSDGVNRTTFTGTVSVQTQSPETPEFYGIDFAGNGGTGLLATRWTVLRQCRFTGWDIGVAAEDGSWVTVANCTFENNAVGLRFNTSYSTGANESYSDTCFYDNETAVLIERLYGTLVLTFDGSRFRGNQTDVSNPDEHPIDLSGAIFE